MSTLRQTIDEARELALDVILVAPTIGADDQGALLSMLRDVRLFLAPENDNGNTAQAVAGAGAG